MITLAPVTLQNVWAFKDVRLRALLDTPTAFGSTYAQESQFPDDEWTRRALRWNGERGIGFLAMDGDLACGIAGSLLNVDATRALLISMWTAPLYRQQGVGRLLVHQIMEWAHQRGARFLDLMVTSNNGPGAVFYERLGFARTGRTGPYPNDPALFEYEMSRPIP